MHAFCDSARTIEKAWDLFQVPYPFSRISLIFSPPIEVPTGADSDTISSKHGEMQSMLERVRDSAEILVSRSPPRNAKGNARSGTPDGLCAEKS